MPIFRHIYCSLSKHRDQTIRNSYQFMSGIVSKVVDWVYIKRMIAKVVSFESQGSPGLFNPSGCGDDAAAKKVSLEAE